MRFSMYVPAILAVLPQSYAQSHVGASSWVISPEGTLRSRTFVLNQTISPSLPEAIVQRGSDLLITDAVAPYVHIFCTETLRPQSLSLGAPEVSSLGALRGRDNGGKWFTEMMVAWSIVAPPKASVAKTTVARLYDDSINISQLGTFPPEIEFPNSYISLNSTHRLVSDSLTGTVWLVHQKGDEYGKTAVPFPNSPAFCAEYRPTKLTVHFTPLEAISLIQHPLLLTPTPKGTALGADGMRFRFVPTSTKPSRSHTQDLEVYIGNESRGLILLFTFSYPDLKPKHSGRDPELVYQPRADGDEVDDFELLSLPAAKGAQAGMGEQVVWATTGSGGGAELRVLAKNNLDAKKGNETVFGSAGQTLAKWQAPEKGAVAASVILKEKGCKVWVGYTTEGFKVGKLAELEVLDKGLKGKLGC